MTMTAAEMCQCLAVPDPRARAALPMRPTTTQTTMKMALALTARMIMTCDYCLLYVSHDYYIITDVLRA